MVKIAFVLIVLAMVGCANQMVWTNTVGIGAPTEVITQAKNECSYRKKMDDAQAFDQGAGAVMGRGTPSNNRAYLSFLASKKAAERLQEEAEICMNEKGLFLRQNETEP